MLNFRKHIPEYRERLDAWLADHGYEPGSAAALPNRWGMMSPLLDHGFIATHKETRRRVLFGDPYEYGLQFLARVEWQFGILARRHAGLWKPDSSTLLELWVDDPLKARELFRRVGVLGNHDQTAVSVRNPSRYLGVSADRLATLLKAHGQMPRRKCYGSQARRDRFMSATGLIEADGFTLLTRRVGKAIEQLLPESEGFDHAQEWSVAGEPWLQVVSADPYADRVADCLAWCQSNGWEAVDLGPDASLHSPGETHLVLCSPPRRGPALAPIAAAWSVEIEPLF